MTVTHSCLSDEATLLILVSVARAAIMFVILLPKLGITDILKTSLGTTIRLVTVGEFVFLLSSWLRDVVSCICLWFAVNKVVVEHSASRKDVYS
ncbi:hypothetical protein E2C01_017754 [Portunus trituberculatus]|uniref:Uncharacterized protein n=1 Tax=Portunus trituberculatus TaxID=210409 RepID=A0A5B7DUP8_PORTR|nr:hypothetical protein [Portunus trituberculatus]